MGDKVINSPIKIMPKETLKLKEEAKFTAPYGAVVLRNPIIPEKANTYFIFIDRCRLPLIYVDTKTKEERTSPY